MPHRRGRPLGNRGREHSAAPPTPKAALIFADLPAGNYTLTPSGVASGLVEHNGNPPAIKTVSVIAGSTSTVPLLYDRPGAILDQITDSPREAASNSLASRYSVVVFNTGMTTAKAFGTHSGARKSEVRRQPLFPFTSPDTVYAGSCEGDNPNPKNETSPPGAAAMASVIVPAGGTAATATIQLPVLNLNVWSGTSAKSPGSRVKSAHVIVSDTHCRGETHIYHRSGRPCRHQHRPPLEHL